MMLVKSLYSYAAAKFNSVNSTAGYTTVSFLAVVLITLIPSLSDAIPLSGGASISPSGISGSANIGGLTLSFGSGGGSGSIGDALCTIVDWFTAGSVGSAVASLAVIFLGIGAFFGKVTWGMAIMFAAGIFSIFGASSIVDAITGGQGFGQACG